MNAKRFHRWTLILAIIAVVLLILAGVVGEVNAASPTPEPACAVTVTDADAGQDDIAEAWAIIAVLCVVGGGATAMWEHWKRRSGR